MKTKTKYWLLGMAVFTAITLLIHLNKSPSHHSSDTLIVGTTANFPPFEFKKDGELVGFDIDLTEALAKRLHKKIVWKDVNFTSLLLEAQRGQIQVIASAMTPTPERSKHILFLPPYLERDPLIIITHKDKPAPHSLADLKGKDVIVNEGYTAEEFMEKQEGIKLNRFSSVAEAFLALNAGRGDAFVSARSATQSFFDRMGTKNYNILALEKDETYAIAVSQKYPALYTTIKTTYDELIKDGTLQTLKKKWHLIW